MRWLLSLGLVAALLYCVYGAALILLQGRFIYPFSDQGFTADGYTRHQIAVPGAAPLPVRMAKAAAGAPVIVYFMGNVGALDVFLPMIEHHRAKGRTVVAMTYRGGGGTEGAASEARLKADADALMRTLPELVGTDAGPVVLHGYSLGTGLAVHIAGRHDVDGVVLSAPYARICELMTTAAKLPACYLPWVQGWRSADDLAGIAAPVLIQHGGADALIPPQHSARLAEAMAVAGIAATRRVIGAAGHADLLQFPEYLSGLDEFIDGLPAP